MWCRPSPPFSGGWPIFACYGDTRGGIWMYSQGVVCLPLRLCCLCSSTIHPRKVPRTSWMTTTLGRRNIPTGCRGSKARGRLESARTFPSYSRNFRICFRHSRSRRNHFPWFSWPKYCSDCGRGWESWGRESQFYVPSPPRISRPKSSRLGLRSARIAGVIRSWGIWIFLWWHSFPSWSAFSSFIARGTRSRLFE